MPKDITFNLKKDLKQLSKLQTPVLASWWQEAQKEGLSRVEQLGWPSAKDEEWKYTNIAPLTEPDYIRPDQADGDFDKNISAYCESDKIKIVFINGTFSQTHSDTSKLPDGIVIKTIKEQIAHNGADIKQLLSKYGSNTDNAFLALNKALANDGCYISVGPNTVIEDIIHIIHVTNFKEGTLLSTPRSVITLGRSSEATVLESHLCADKSSTYLSNALTDIYIDENATLHYYKAQDESPKAFHVGHTRVWQEKNSHYDSFSLMTGGAITRNNLNIILDGEGITSTLNGLYFVRGDQHVDNHSSVNHRFPNCDSNQLYKGILTEASRAVFNGKIFVQPIAQKTNSYQLNKNLLLGEKCRVDTKPQLEIFADDVKCTHGATIGQLNHDELFYLQSRCIPKKDAVQILSRGFIDDVLNHIQNPSINQKLHLLLEPAFAAL